MFSGQLRTLNSLISDFDKLFESISEIDFEHFICDSIDTEDKYSAINNFDNIIGSSHLRLFERIRLSPLLDIQNNFDIPIEKIHNTIRQWEKIKVMFSNIPKNKYDFIIRIRPDICILEDSKGISKLFKNLQAGRLYIPDYFDIYDKEIYHEKYSKYQTINDQICIGSYDVMKQYCCMYDYLYTYSNNLPFISEIMLSHHINKLPISRFKLNYKLILSDCHVIAISGDSGSGKTTLMKNIKPIIHFKQLLCIESDKYHKWGRGDKNWKSYTHLNPEANHLEKMYEDTYRLKIGQNIYTIDYDHSTGKFTEPYEIESKPNIILCGLHTIYNEKMYGIINLKIFVDTQEELKIWWKLKRDTEERGYTEQQIIESIKKRRPDFEKYVKPQREKADIIYHQWSDKFEGQPEVQTEILLNKDFFTNNSNHLNPKLFANSICGDLIRITYAGKNIDHDHKTLLKNFYVGNSYSFEIKLFQMLLYSLIYKQ